MVIRRAISEDASSIAAIHVRSWQSAYQGIVPKQFLQTLSIERRTATWQEALAARTSDVWVAELEGRLLGWISVGKSRDADACADTAELWAVYVDPSAWRRGVGRALWREAEFHLKSLKNSQVTLWVLLANSIALRFYDSLGFVIDPGSTKKLQIGGAELVEIRLRRYLSG
jgi:ribosomal protein S18 acetylase RimI-like enzyme